MKKTLGKFSKLFILMLVLALLTYPVNALAEEKEKKTAFAEQNLRVTAEIPLFQQLKIIKKKDLDYYSLMRNYEGSREIIIEEALALEVWSNSAWQLRLNNQNLDLQVEIKKSGQNDSKWQKLNSTTAKFVGKNGIQKINFDLKFILTEKVGIKADNFELNLRHHLAPILY